VLVVSEKAVKDHGLKPRARVVPLSVRGDDPIWMLTAPIPATKRALQRAGLRLETSTSSRSTRPSRRWCWPGRASRRRSGEVNPNGGAIALGHPLGAPARGSWRRC
jgi:acetyl-CoA C-acetyltransferase